MERNEPLAPSGTDMSVFWWLTLAGLLSATVFLALALWESALQAGGG